jgi:hypothetical protein
MIGVQDTKLITAVILKIKFEEFLSVPDFNRWLFQFPLFSSLCETCQYLTQSISNMHDRRLMMTWRAA